MSLSLKISDATFTQFVAQIPPYIELAKAFYLFGTDEASSVKNWANVALPASAVGTPTYSAGYATLNSTANGFAANQTASKSPFTHLAVISGVSEGYFGNWLQSGGSPAQANAAVSHVGLVKMAIDANYRVIGSAIGTGFKVLVGSHDGTTAKLYQPNSSSLNKVSAAYTSGSAAADFRVGAIGIAGATNFNCAAAMTFGSVLTDGQIQEIYDYLKTLLAARGVTVV